MKSIKVCEPEMSSAGKLTVTLQQEDKSSILFFDFGKYYDIHPDAIAASMGIMLKNTGREIVFDFPISDNMVSKIRQHTGSNIVARKSCSPEDEADCDNTALGFSGGFDSLTARDLLPEDTQLLSFDFMGPFSRERAMYERFPTNIIQTNLVELGLNRNTWAFMTVGARLLRGNLNFGVLSFGTVIEAREKYLRSFAAQRQLGPSTLTSLTKLDIYNPILGMTEVGTAAYVSRNYPKDLASILGSVANPGEEKSYRKSLLIEAVNYRSNSCPDTSIVPRRVPAPAKPQNVWGKSLALDFLSIYLINTLGLDTVQAAYKTPIPKDARTLANETDLAFYEKINMNFYPQKRTNEQLFRRTITRASERGIYPYSWEDYKSFASISTYLKRSNRVYLETDK